MPPDGRSACATSEMPDLVYRRHRADTERMRSRRRFALLLLFPIAAVGITSCSFGATGCPGWAAFDTPLDAAKDAEAVVVGQVTDLIGTTDMLGATANVWSVQVERWQKGEGGEEIEVVSPPSQCGPEGDAYLGAGDPFENARSDGPSVVFLTRDGGWRAITPLQGIVPADRGEVPAEWPAGLPGSPPLNE